MLEDYLDERDRLAKAAAHKAERDGAIDEGSPDVMINELLAEIGRLFYAKNDGERFLKHQPALKLALTWQAGWLKQRGVTLPLARYRAILVEIIQGIAEHGDRSKIGYFPAYFLHCLQQWFVHNGEEVYARQKSIRNAIDLSFLKGAVQASAAPDPIDTLAAAHRVLARHRRPAKAQKPADSQPSLFDV